MVARYSNFHRFLWPQKYLLDTIIKICLLSRYKSFLPAKMLKLMALFVQTTHSKVKKCVAFFKNNFSFADVHLANVWKFHIYGVWQARADLVCSISMNLNNDGLLFFTLPLSLSFSLSLSTLNTQTRVVSLAMCADEANFFFLKLSIARHSIIVTLRCQIESYKLLSFITAPPTHRGKIFNLISLCSFYHFFFGFRRFISKREKKPLIAIKICKKGW